MAKYFTSKYGTKINVEGLTPEQVAKVQSMAESKGAYGSKGAALAKQFQKQSGGGKVGIPKGEVPGGINPNTGAINPADYFSQAPKMPGAQDLQGDVNAARNAAFNYSTQYYGKDKAQEMEDQKQEFANRGIPLDTTQGSLYQKGLEGIDRKYQGMYDQANNLAIGQGNSILQTESGVAGAANSAFLNAVLGMSAADMQKYGIDKDFKAKMAAIAAQNRGGGGAAPVAEDTGPQYGGSAPGFGL